MEIPYIAFLTVLASLVGTFAGFGTSTVMVPLLLGFLPLVPTLLLVGIIHWFGDLWKIFLWKRGLHLTLFLTFGLPAILASYLGARLIFSLSEETLLRLLGLFLVVYSLIFLSRASFTLKARHHTAVMGGALSGFLSGIFGVGGAVRSAFLSAYNLPKEVYLATSGVIGLAVDSARLITYWSEGAFISGKLAWGLLLFIPASFVGAELAKGIADRIPERRFRTIIFILLFILGVKLLILPS